MARASAVSARSSVSLSTQSVGRPERDREPGEVALGGEALGQAQVLGAARRARDEVVAVEHRDVGGGRAGQLAGPLGGVPHRRAEVGPEGRDLVLQLESRAQEVGVRHAVCSVGGAHMWAYRVARGIA